MIDPTAHTQLTEAGALRALPRQVPRGRVIHRQGRPIIPPSTPANLDIVLPPAHKEFAKSPAEHLFKMGLSGFVIGLVCSAVLISPRVSLPGYSSSHLLSFMSDRLSPVPASSPVLQLDIRANRIVPTAGSLTREVALPSVQRVKNLPTRTNTANVSAVSEKAAQASSMRLAAYSVEHHRPTLNTIAVPNTREVSHPAPVPLSPSAHRNTVNRVHSIIRKYAPKNQNPHILADAIVRESRHQGYDPLFVAAVIKSESTFNPSARSHKGAQGLMQIMPATGQWLQSKNDIPRGKLTDPGHNLRVGIAYLKYLEQEFHGNRIFTLVAYNWGPGHVQSATGGKRRIPKECMTYALKILNDYQRWQSGLI